MGFLTMSGCELISSFGARASGRRQANITLPYESWIFETSWYCGATDAGRGITHDDEAEVATTRRHSLSCIDMVIHVR